ncbi:uncharacterized protein DMAD_00676 [Drosophila madeirensis]|uniref:Uncharacterized protein n=1 Tax=Drosophila madeirensis TaxID=30013 RepID=A0AAU9FX56_DROMD
MEKDPLRDDAPRGRNIRTFEAIMAEIYTIIDNTPSCSRVNVEARMMDSLLDHYYTELAMAHVNESAEAGANAASSAAGQEQNVATGNGNPMEWMSPESPESAESPAEGASHDPSSNTVVVDWMALDICEMVWDTEVSDKNAKTLPSGDGSQEKTNTNTKAKDK